MKKIYVVVASLSFLMFLCVSSASAITSVQFGDSSKYWTGWGNNSSDDNLDTIGEPNINPNNAGGIATFDNGRLTGISFTVQGGRAAELWDIRTTPGDLFISTNSNNSWEYLVDLTTSSTWTTAGKLSNYVPGGAYSLYSMTTALGSSSSNPGYTLSGSDNSLGWSGFLIRDAHPVAWGGSLPTAAYGSVNFSGWDNTLGTGINALDTISFDFSGLNGGGLAYSDGSITIGWAVNCANDVIYERIAAPVPEPATLFLLGLGLIGLAGARRKFNK